MKSFEDYGIGNTPITMLSHCNNNKIFIKLEGENFLGSIKSRPAYYMVRNIEKNNIDKVTESTSGNLGLAIDYFMKDIGKIFLCLIDETISVDKLKTLKRNNVSYKIVEKYKDLDYRSSRIRYAKILQDTKGYYWSNQYESYDNYLSHYETTGPEIYNQLEKNIDILVCGVGSGGTISGISSYLKKMCPTLIVVGVEPNGSTIFGGSDGEYLNVGTGLKGPSKLVEKHMNIIDFHVHIKDSDAIKFCMLLNDEYDLNVGISTGMVYAACVAISEHCNNKRIAMISPDKSDSYITLLNKIKEGFYENS